MPNSKRCPVPCVWKKPSRASRPYGGLFLFSLLILTFSVGCRSELSETANLDGVVTVDGTGLDGVRVRLIEEGVETREQITTDGGQFRFNIQFFGDILGTGNRNITVTIDQLPPGVICPSSSQNVMVSGGDDRIVRFECVRSS